MQTMRLLLTTLLVVSTLAAQTGAEEFFEKQIRPVLVARCYGCHGPQAKPARGNLRLDLRSGLRSVVSPGNVAGSKLFTAISYTNLDLRMPPTGKLPEAEISAFRQWIEAGAHDPRPDQGAASPAAANRLSDPVLGRRFWAFQPLKVVDPAGVKNSAWARTTVDRYLLARLEAKGLSPAAEAARNVWLRRVTFDLTGLPPTPAELDAFGGDKSDRAYETVVERLLTSPHYGERWARHWLDLVRFAETNGHEFDNDKLDAWRYRDYVIRAFNEDVPYPQLIQEHLAGDLLPNPRVSKDGAHLESPLGTSMFWFGEVLNSATDSVKSRADTVDNQIDVLGKTFLGLTVACARCHDHKFDPIPTRDYYALAGVLHSTNIREAVVDSPERAAAITAAHERVRATQAQPKLGPQPEVKLREGDVVFEDFASQAEWYGTGEAFRKQWEPGFASSLGYGTARVVGSLTSKKFRMPKLWVHVRLAGSAADREKAGTRLTIVADDHKSAHLYPTGKPGFAWRSARMTKEIGRSCYFELVDRDPKGWIAVDRIIFSDNEKPPVDEAGAASAEELKLAEADIPASTWGMISFDEDPHDVKLHVRGNHKNLGDAVPRGFLRVIADSLAVAQGSGRLEVAERVAASPLAVRVLVNRVWKHHFGYGLVRTTDNFGQTGERPTHPELLDYLASGLVKNNGSIKWLHREIVLSAAYRMSSTADKQAAETDPRNELLHHFPVRRLEAEAIRDSILAVSGRLDPTLYGPSVAPYISKYQDGRGKPKPGPLDGGGRRSLYIQVRRNFLTPMFLAFDYPLPISTIGTRGSSTVPSQALLMLNNEFVAEQARIWADKVSAEVPAADARVDTMYRLAFARSPEEWEKRETLEFTARRGWAELAHVLLNSAEFLYVR